MSFLSSALAFALKVCSVTVIEGTALSTELDCFGCCRCSSLGCCRCSFGCGRLLACGRSLGCRGAAGLAAIFHRPVLGFDLSWENALAASATSEEVG